MILCEYNFLSNVCTAHWLTKGFIYILSHFGLNLWFYPRWSTSSNKICGTTYKWTLESVDKYSKFMGVRGVKMISSTKLFSKIGTKLVTLTFMFICIYFTTHQKYCDFINHCSTWTAISTSLYNNCKNCSSSRNGNAFFQC